MVPRPHLAFACVLLLLVLEAPTGPAAGDGGTLDNERTRFTDVTEEAGLADVKYSRVAWGDYDGDGWEDLVLNGRSLWRNLGGGRFQDVTTQAGLHGIRGVGGVWADYDNDGDLDLYTIARSFDHRDALWRNDGDGTFTDVTVQAGSVYDLLPSEGAAWADYDDDGYVDLYVANYETASVDGDQELGIGTPDVLWHNDGGIRFENATREAGMELDGEELCGRGVAWCDYDDDGDQDVYVSNYRLDPNLLWRNDGGDFTNVAADARAEGYGTDTGAGGPRYGHTIGSDWGDYDNDGDMDLYASNLAHPRFIMFSDKPMLLSNRGDGAFVDRWYGSGIAYCETSSDCAWADYDNDGDLDLYFTAIYEGRLSRLFRNVGRDRFEDATGESRTTVDNGWGCAWCDWDHDGDLDLAVGSGSGVRLMRNDGNENHWLQVELEGTQSNRAAIGARVRVTADGVSQVRDVKGGKGTTSQDMLACHFGLGDHDGEVEVEVRWPGSASWVEAGTYAADQRVRVKEGEVDIDAAVSLSVDPPSPRVGDQVTLSVIVASEGEATVEEARVRTSVQGVGQATSEETLGPIEPGADESLDSIWQPLAEGVYTVVAQLLEVLPYDSDPDNDAASVTVTVRAENQPPVARLSVDTAKLPPRTAFTFDASDSTDDSAVGSYLFDYGDGSTSGWTLASVATHEYELEGDYLVDLTVQDEDGTYSTNAATVTVTVTGRGFRPTAEIIQVLPDEPREGEVVTLHGRGTAAEGAAIAEHLWSSSIDGELGTGSMVTVSDLSLGDHTIVYKVQDTRGLWSDPATVGLEVLPAEGVWSLVVRRPGEGDEVTGDTLVVEGTASYTAGAVVAVEVRLDDGEWEMATGTGEWGYGFDLTELAEGVHLVSVRATSHHSASETAFVNFTLGAGGDDDFDWRAWLLTTQGIATVLVVAALANVAVWAARRRGPRRPRRS